MLMMFSIIQKNNAKNAFIEFNSLEHPLHCFLASCFEVLINLKHFNIFFKKNRKISNYFNKF